MMGRIGTFAGVDMGCADDDISCQQEFESNLLWESKLVREEGRRGVGDM